METEALRGTWGAARHLAPFPVTLSIHSAISRACRAAMRAWRGRAGHAS